MIKFNDIKNPVKTEAEALAWLAERKAEKAARFIADIKNVDLTDRHSVELAKSAKVWLRRNGFKF